jgi:hypothetical protein
MDDWARELRVEMWARLLQGRAPTAEDIAPLQRLWAARELLNEQNQRALRLCLACAALASNGTPALREELRIFLAYYLSRDGSAPLRDVPRPRSPEELTLEWLRGRELSWEEIFTIFGRMANPDRIRRLLREQLQRLGGELR